MSVQRVACVNYERVLSNWVACCLFDRLGGIKVEWAVQH